MDGKQEVIANGVVSVLAAKLVENDRDSERDSRESSEVLRDSDSEHSEEVGLLDISREPSLLREVM